MSDPDSRDLEPAEVVRRFIADMHVWEVQSAADHETSPPQDYQALWSRVQAAQDVAFARWCTPKERPYGRKGSFERPPEYQPEHERVLEACLEGPRRALVYTQAGTGTKNKWRYVLFKQAGRWLIDNKKYLNADGSWTSYFL